MKLDFTEPELDYIAHLRRRSIYGSPSEVRDRLEELSAEYDVDEFIVVTITYDFAKRVRSYELLAEEFGITALPKGPG
jgi:alkanesulfonate monooxygenase SsuD/methylene tetrahydromethanopterin reductase-like flavin-dependent oxidoreductase (luciferase family)